MARNNKELMVSARESLQGNWPLVIGTFLAYGLVANIGGMINEYGSLLGMIIAGPLQLGLAIFTLNIVRKQEIEFTQIFQGFNKFLESLLAYLLVILYVLLWSLLLIIPGIIASFAYSQVFYILADNSEIKPADALKQSKEMMKGNKARLFYLNLRFFGWFLLAILTLGIGFLWLIPYIQVTMAEFYQEIKG